MQLIRRIATLPPLVLSVIISHASADPLFGSRLPLESPIKRVLEYSPATSPDTQCTKVLRPTLSAPRRLM